MTVVVLGAAGYLGEVTVREWRAAGHAVAALTRADLDLTHHDALRDRLRRLDPAVVINCAADNRVDGAEGDPSGAFAVNAWAVRALARALSGTPATLVHYSTDFVFDGCADRPYREDDAPNPQGAYAASKLIGEWFAAEVERHFVLRVESLFGGDHPRGTIDAMIARLRGGETVTAFSDRVVSPSDVGDVARATRHLVESGAPPGVYHCVNTGAATWLEVAQALRAWLGREAVPIQAVPAATVPLPARRPQYAALDNAKLVQTGAAMRPWREALRDRVSRPLH